MRIMESKIIALYGELRDITAGYMIYQDRKIVSEILRKMPQIQEFILWFVEKNRLPVNETDFLDMRKVILDIMKDIMDAIEIGDIVLLNDAVAYGLMDYMELFIEVKEE